MQATTIRARVGRTSAYAATAATTRSLTCVAACSWATLHSLRAHPFPHLGLRRRDQVQQDPVRGHTRVEQPARTSTAACSSASARQCR